MWAACSATRRGSRDSGNTRAGRPGMSFRTGAARDGGAYAESAGMDTDLNRVTSPVDGYLDEVPLLRELYKADFVSLWGVYGGSCGIGWLMTTESSTFQANAYNVVADVCTGPGVYTFAHELGHNMGLRHDNYVDTTPQTEVSPEGAPVDPGTTTIT